MRLIDCCRTICLSALFLRLYAYGDRPGSVAVSLNMTAELRRDAPLHFWRGVSVLSVGEQGLPYGR